MASNMRDFGTAPTAMDAMAVEKNVMAKVGNKGEDVVKPSKRRRTKFCKPNKLFWEKVTNSNNF